VVRATLGAHMLVRRSRGWVPGPLPIPEPVEEPALALGAHLQATACVACGSEAFPSQHVGDLDTDPARAFLREVAGELEEFLQVRSRVVAVDLHPDYASTWIGEEIARDRGARLFRVQHHLAHAAAVLGEHEAFPRPEETAAAIVLDGTGYGPDGTAWGGEFLLIEGSLRWRRAAHLESFPLVGGEKAVAEPWRILAAALALEGETDLIGRLPVAEQVPADRLMAVARIASTTGGPAATGAGRIFEAAGAMLGLAVRNDYKGEAAARLESLAATARGSASPWPLSLRNQGGRVLVPARALLVEAARRLLDGAGPADVAAGFHATFCALIVETAARVFPRNVSRVAIGGGCLVNRYLLRGLTAGLAEAGFHPLAPQALPPGDGGISYGQALIATVALARGAAPVLQGGS